MMQEIDSILDNTAYMTIVNSSGWNLTKMITLVEEEVLLKRLGAMDAFRRGLDKLGIIDLLKKHPDEISKLNQNKLDAEMFTDLMETPPPSPADDIQNITAHKWFLEYLLERENCIGKLC